MVECSNLYIIDASVILKWFFDEESEHREEALAIKKAHENSLIHLAIPHYAYAEVLNLLGIRLPFGRAVSYFSYLVGLNFREHAVNLTIASLALELMKKYKGISFYDAGYHALALEQGGTFLTADKKYYRKTRKAGHIMLLKDYGKKR